MNAERIARLVARFDGAIKYAPMLADHTDWSDEQCLEFARKWHAAAIERLKSAVPDSQGIWWRADRRTWNHKIPYCRNNPTPALLKEAGK